MAKLYFRYGAVGSAKTMNLLAVAHNYRQQKKGVLLVKPRLDTRFGSNMIKSRSGLVMQADVLVDDHSILNEGLIKGNSCILVDEAQFLSAQFVDHLREIASKLNIPVICYGLRTDFCTHLFDGSQRLLELADSIEEIKTTCAFCNKKAIFNMKLINGMPTQTGPIIDLGAEEKYLPTCSRCYHTKLGPLSSQEEAHKF